MEPWQRVDLAARDEARRVLSTCCGSSAWVERMLRRRPFGSTVALLAGAREAWTDLTHTDWLEAFSHHPKIGDRASRARRFPGTAHLSSREQSGVDAAAAGVLDALATGNRAYEDKFGYIFIVCATGRSATDMLEMLGVRLGNDPAEEIRIAAGEQAKITELRLLGLGAS
jgi:2-oxo-4-hydroxy-4-carboxy-5-ureidoimidazoline decarboxylase